MIIKNIEEQQRLEILSGISLNHSYNSLSNQTGVPRRELIRYVQNMRRAKDPELLKALKQRDTKIAAEKRVISDIHNDSFIDMTGMTLREKTFQNMLHFYKPELLHIMKSRDQKTAIGNLPVNVRKTLKRNGIITQRKTIEITKQALEQLNFMNKVKPEKKNHE
jgi:hypothetical protein